MDGVFVEDLFTRTSACSGSIDELLSSKIYSFTSDSLDIDLLNILAGVRHIIVIYGCIIIKAKLKLPEEKET